PPRDRPGPADSCSRRSGRSDGERHAPVDHRRQSGCPGLAPRHGTRCGEGVAATWFLPALLAAYNASSAARNRSSAVPASSSGRLATQKLDVTILPCEKGYLATTSRMRSA